MKVLATFLFSSALLLAAAPSASAQGDEKSFYSRRYDSLDVNTIFRSSRLLNNYVDCLLDKKPCPPEGKDLKRVLPDALRTRCSRCTKLQKEKALDVITRLYYQHPSVYTALAERYDPAGEYTRNFENWFDEQNAVKPRPPIPQDRIQQDEAPSNVKITAVESPTGPTTSANEVSSTQQAIRRSPNIIDSGAQRFPNKVQTDRPRTRIPSTWITSSTTTTTARSTSTRAPLRTSHPTVRSPTVRAPPAASRPLQSQPQPTFLIDNIFAPRPNGPITRSINKIINTTEQVVNSFAGMFRSTIEIITGTG